MLPDGLLEDWLGLTDAADIALAEGAADRALAWISTQTGRYFGEPMEFVLRFSGGRVTDYRKTFWLPEIPLTEIVESDEVDMLLVEEKNSAEAWVTIEDTEYELIRGPFLYEMPILEHDDYWPAGRKNIRVTYTAGYEVGSLPLDIQQMVLDAVGEWWRARGNQGLKSESIDGYSYENWAQSDGRRFLADGMSTLSKWKHPVMGSAY